jgi:outer membrane immunogenic protein
MTIWRSSLLALAVSAGLATGAMPAAADGPTKGARGAEFPNIPWAWQGLYGGVHLGSAEVGNDDGLVGGVQIGHNWQNGKVIYGIEGDISFTDFEGVDWMGTVRGRLGYLISPSILIYGTGGLGVIDFDGGSESEFVYGLGIEGRLTQATTVRLEYIGWSDSEIDVIRAGLNLKFNW